MSEDSPIGISDQDLSSEALIVFDDQNRVVDASGLACELMGYTREDLLSCSLQDLAASPEASRLLEKFQEEATLAFEAGLRVEDGRRHAFHLRLKRLSLPGHRDA